MHEWANASVVFLTGEKLSVQNNTIIFEVLLLMLLKSRATIIGFAICLLYIIFGKQFKIGRAHV